MSKDEENGISSKLQQLTDQNTRILHILENDDKVGRKGLVQSVDIMRIELDSLVHAYKVYKAVKRKENMIFGSIGAAVLMILKWVGGALFPFLTKL